MHWAKRLEAVAKHALALLAGLLLWRPGRRRRAAGQLDRARRVLLVRVDDRVGEALLMTPLLEALAASGHAFDVDVLVHARAVRVLEGHPRARAVIALDRRWLALGAWAPGIRPLRRAAYDAVLDCANWDAPSVTSAIVSRLAGASSAVVGPALWPLRALRDVPVEPRPDTRSELLQRLHLLSPLRVTSPSPHLSFREPRTTEPIRAFLGAHRNHRLAIVNPGGRLGDRRLPPGVFAAAAEAARGAGRTPIVTWGPGEEALAQAVADAVPGAVLAPPTDLDALAALMRASGAVICNNTGPMHLSVATGAATLAFFLNMDPERWGYPSAPHRVVDLTREASSPERAAELARQQTAHFLASL